MNNIRKRAEELKDQIIKDRRQLHQNAEVGMDLPATAAYVKKRLIEMGYEPKDCGTSGVTATVGSGAKTILLRADMDALPMEELSGLEFTSANPGCAHTCGHDTHAAMLLGAAQILKETEAELKGTVKFMFQPGEEIFAGAKSMIENGILENPKVDAAMGMHIFAIYPFGTIGYCPKDMMASVDGFRVEITGVGCHGAQSYAGVDPINIAVHIHLAFQELISREIDSSETALLTVGKLQAGDAANIIPQNAVMEGTIRTFNNEVRSYLVKRMQEVAVSVAKTYRGTAKVEMLYEVPTNYTNEALLKEMMSYMEELDDPDLHLLQIPPLSGSEDFSLIAAKVPSIFVGLGADFPGKDTVKFPHNPKVVFNENIFPAGSALYAQCAVEWLKNNS